VVDGIVPVPALVGNYVLFLAVRQLIIYLAWVVAAALAGAGACWCCGYGAQAAWGKAETARQAWHEARRARNPKRDEITVEAERGIEQIEEYLAARSIILPRPERVDEDESG